MITHLEGDPAQIETTAAYLRGTLGRGAAALADTGAAQRVRLASGWEGEAGSAFGERARLLVTASDDLAATAEGSATELDDLAASLRNAHDQLVELRWRAVAAGLEVTDSEILPPHYDPSPRLSPVGDPAEAGQPGYWDRREAYLDLDRRHEQILLGWKAALDATAGHVQRNAETLTLITVNLLSAAFTAHLLRLNSTIMEKQAAWFYDEARRAQWLAEEKVWLAREGRIRFDYGEYDELRDRVHRAETAAQAARDAPHPKFPGRINTSFGLLTTGYGVYADMRDGESASQAAASQGLGLLGAGGAAAACSFIPLAGTLTCGAVGIAGGIATDKGFDWVVERDDEEDRPRHGSSGARGLPPDESRISVLLGGPGFVPPSAGPVTP